MARPLEAPSAPLWRAVHSLAVAGARAGDGLLWVIVGGLAYLLSGAEGRRNVAFVALSVLLAGIIVSGIKLLTRRQRPETLEERASYYQAFDAYAFPSGHACRMACIAVTVGGLQPSLSLPFWLLAIWVMASRIMLGIHHVLDIVVGGLVGALVGSLAQLVR